MRGWWSGDEEQLVAEGRWREVGAAAAEQEEGERGPASESPTARWVEEERKNSGRLWVHWRGFSRDSGPQDRGAEIPEDWIPEDCWHRVRSAPREIRWRERERPRGALAPNETATAGRAALLCFVPVPGEDSLGLFGLEP